MKHLTCFLIFVGLVGCAVEQTPADIVVDFSPTAVLAGGGTLGVNTWANEFDSQVVADSFYWPGGELTGGSVFSTEERGAVGDGVRLVVLAALGAGEIPLIDVTTTLDAVDSLYSVDGTTRKHATITATYLAEGNYYFYLTGVSDPRTDIGAATGLYDDGLVYIDTNGNPDIGDTDGRDLGDLLFQIEGNVQSMPEPNGVFVICAIGLFVSRRRRRSSR